MAKQAATHKHEPTPQQRKMVESMSAYGIPQEDIAKVVGIDRKTLAKHYRDELDTATAKANAKVAETLYKQATNADNPRSATAAIFWLKTRGGWRETSNLNHVSEDNTMSPAGPAQDAALAAMNRKHCDPE